MLNPERGFDNFPQANIDPILKDRVNMIVNGLYERHGGDAVNSIYSMRMYLAAIEDLTTPEAVQDAILKADDQAKWLQEHLLPDEFELVITAFTKNDLDPNP